MPNYRRFRVEGGIYFFTVVTYLRRPILTSPFARKLLHVAWMETAKKRPFETIAISLLPDHLHCIWKLPDGDDDYSTRWNTIKGIFSKKFLELSGYINERTPSQTKRREAAIWQRRFWEHTILDEEDFENHLDYIHFNPIKHGFVERAVDWEWSSFQRYVKEGLYDNEWAGENEGRLLAYGLDE